MKQVNLREILMQNGVDIQDDYVGENQPLINVLDAMKEACEQSIELVIENIDDCTDLDEETDAGCTYVLSEDKIRILNNQIV